jgi:hypothetical protein
MSSIVLKHEQALRKRFKAKTTEEGDKTRRREAMMWTVIIFAIVSAAFSSALAWKYAGTIAWAHDLQETNRFGQVIGHSGTIEREPADLQTHSFFAEFVREAYSVYNSKIAMVRNYADIDSMFDQRAVVEKSKLYAYWDKTSPLHEDGFWDSHAVNESDAALISVLSRGSTEGGGTEYQINFTITPAADGAAVQYWNADFILVSGGRVTDADPHGFYITHYSASEQT